jgi:hypothetical protein
VLDTINVAKDAAVEAQRIASLPAIELGAFCRRAHEEAAGGH